MQEDFHYYATYSASYLAGFSHKESLEIAYFAQLVDLCSASFLSKVKGPKSAATTQLNAEMMNIRMDIIGLQNITRIWSSFHFLPRNLYATFPRLRPLNYMNKYRLICGPNGDLTVDTVELARDKGLEAIGIAMHVLADTWAHRYFAGIPSYVINNTNDQFYEILETPEGETEKKVYFGHNPRTPDDLEKSGYTTTIRQAYENTVMNLGHGRAGHLPDYSFAKYKYMPAWGNYRFITKDNPKEYYKAFCQMVYALRCLKTGEPYQKSTYDYDIVLPYKEEIDAILKKRRFIATDDWKAFAQKLSGEIIEDFDVFKYTEDYITAAKSDKDKTALGRFFLAAMAHKSMVTNKIFKSKNLLAGFSVDYKSFGFKGIKDFRKLIETQIEKIKD